MKNLPKTDWRYSNGNISIDPFRQKIIHISGEDRHSDAWESYELLNQYLTNSNGISSFVHSNKELVQFKNEINLAVNYYCSDEYRSKNQTIFDLNTNDLIDFSSQLKVLRRKKKRAMILYFLFVIILNLGIYAATHINQKIAYLFIASSFISIIILFTMVSEFLNKPKFGKGLITNYKTGKSTVVDGKQISITSYFLVIGQQNLYSFKNNKIDQSNFFLENEITYQVSQALYFKYKFSGTYINFITSSKNEIFEIIDSQL